MINRKRYVLIRENEITQQMRDNTIPYGIHYSQILIEISGEQYEILKWRNDKPAELWSEYPVYSNEELIDYLETHATFPPPP